MKNKLFLLLLIFFLMIVYGQWFLPGPRVANDFPIVSDSIAKSFMDVPRLWTEKGAVGLGEYTIFTSWSYPVALISGVLANLGIRFAILERIILISILLLGATGIWQMVGYLRLGYPAKVVAGLFYLANTYILLLIDGGQLSIALSYGWFPICFLLVEKAIGSTLKRQLFAGLAIAILGFFDIRFIYLLLILALIRFIYELVYLDPKKWGRWMLSWVKLGGICGVVVVFLHSFWLLPLSYAPLSNITFNQLVQTSFISFTTMGHSLMLISPHWFKNVFGQVSPLRWEFILIPILVFLAPILKPKEKQVGFWLLVALISVFLAKGTSPPFPQVYSWLFLNVPGFSLFRDSSKFFFLVGLSYSLLIAVTVDEVFKLTKMLPKIQLITSLILISYLLLLTFPAWQGQMTGTFAKPPLQKDYSGLKEILASDEDFSRVFWIPFTVPLSYSSTQHPIVEAARLVQTRPFNIGTKGTYETFNFLREAPFMGEIFDVSGIGYIVYPYLDPRRNNLHPDNIKYFYTFSNQLSELPWLTKIDHSPISLWQTKTHQDRFFITPNIWWVIGSDDIYNRSIESEQLKLSQNALIFAEERSGLGKRIDEVPGAKIVLNNKTLTDLAASFIDPKDFIFPSKNLDFHPDESGWWKREGADLIRWRDFLQTKYGIDNQDLDLGGGWAVGEGEKKYKILNIKNKKDSILLARVLESTRSGGLKFYQDDNFIGEINTKKEGNNIRWFEVGELVKDGNIIIKTSGQINVVNALATLRNDEWQMYKDKAQRFQDQGSIIDFNKDLTKKINAKVTYQKINSTKYIVKVENLNGPSFLVFSSTFDSLWKLNGKSSLPVYSLLNGFWVDQDGEYILEFEVQNWVYPGLIISFSTLIILIFLIIKKRKSNPS